MGDFVMSIQAFHLMGLILLFYITELFFYIFFIIYFPENIDICNYVYDYILYTYITYIIHIEV